MTHRLALALSFCAIFLCGCARDVEPPPLPLHYPVTPCTWPTAMPSEVGLNPLLLKQADSVAESYPFMLSLLVVRRGRLAWESYFHGAEPTMACHIHSASKSFTSALVGIAHDQGLLGRLSLKMLAFFPEYDTSDLDPRKSAITVSHLLTMHGGFQWDESESAWNRYAGSSNWVDYAIRLPLIDDPGARFNYCSPGTNLLAVIVARAAGMTLLEFARAHLFGPLGIQIGHWHRDPQGNFTGGHEMYFAPRDMARFGLLFLQGGLLDGRRIISAQWVADSIQPRAMSGWEWSPMQERGYGYQWWLGRLAGLDVFLAGGKGGQLIICIPDREMVVVTTANGDAWEGSWGQLQQILGIVADFVIPAAS